MHQDILDDGFQNAEPEFDPKTITRINDLKIEINDHLKKMLQGRYTLIALVALSFLAIAVTLVVGNPAVTTTDIIVEGAILVVFYAGLAFLVKYNPLLAFSLGLGLYILYQLLTGIVDPSSIVKGWLIKIVVIIALSRAIHGAVEAKKLLQKLRDMGVPRRETDIVFNELQPIPRTKRKRIED
ncbi:hypothetical protein QWY85_02155 [Neolewinella lacunae]|uniref:Uncharacterized protein n=1 Tax=Neolewinella lacunae TaxID=1517758 RepID=A0A923PMA7_9BACT|nr:hypothetical protein [Neolewinella lacunae]MBC6996692.1 hypothetical protein [Neolewinella lacunae]MDN3633443.1 hypothetical protein [Neolewinella lacunae]